MNKDKPVYTMDLLPSLEAFGQTGFIITFIALILLVLLGKDFGILVAVMGLILFTMGGFAGREFEAIFYKKVFADLPEEFLQQFNAKAKELFKKEIEEIEEKRINKDPDQEEESK